MIRMTAGLFMVTAPILFSGIGRGADQAASPVSDKGWYRAVGKDGIESLQRYPGAAPESPPPPPPPVEAKSNALLMGVERLKATVDSAKTELVRRKDLALEVVRLLGEKGVESCAGGQDLAVGIWAGIHETETTIPGLAALVDTTMRARYSTLTEQERKSFQENPETWSVDSAMIDMAFEVLGMIEQEFPACAARDAAVYRVMGLSGLGDPSLQRVARDVIAKRFESCSSLQDCLALGVSQALLVEAAPAVFLEQDDSRTALRSSFERVCSAIVPSKTGQEVVKELCYQVLDLRLRTLESEARFRVMTGYGTRANFGRALTVDRRQDVDGFWPEHDKLVDLGSTLLKSLDGVGGRDAGAIRESIGRTHRGNLSLRRYFERIEHGMSTWLQTLNGSLVSYLNANDDDKDRLALREDVKVWFFTFVRFGLHELTLPTRNEWKRAQQLVNETLLSNEKDLESDTEANLYNQASFFADIFHATVQSNVRGSMSRHGAIAFLDQTGAEDEIFNLEDKEKYLAEYQPNFGSAMAQALKVEEALERAQFTYLTYADERRLLEQSKIGAKLFPQVRNYEAKVRALRCYAYQLPHTTMKQYREFIDHRTPESYAAYHDQKPDFQRRYRGFFTSDTSPPEDLRQVCGESPRVSPEAEVSSYLNHQDAVATWTASKSVVWQTFVHQLMGLGAASFAGHVTSFFTKRTWLNQLIRWSYARMAWLPQVPRRGALAAATHTGRAVIGAGSFAVFQTPILWGLGMEPLPDLKGEGLGGVSALMFEKLALGSVIFLVLPPMHQAAGGVLARVQGIKGQGRSFSQRLADSVRQVESRGGLLVSGTRIGVDTVAFATSPLVSRAFENGVYHSAHAMGVGEAWNYMAPDRIPDAVWQGKNEIALGLHDSSLTAAVFHGNALLSQAIQRYAIRGGRR